MKANMHIMYLIKVLLNFIPVFYLIIKKFRILLYTVLVGVQTMKIFVQKTCLLFFMLSWIFLKFAGLTANHAAKKKKSPCKRRRVWKNTANPQKQAWSKKERTNLSA